MWKVGTLLAGSISAVLIYTSVSNVSDEILSMTALLFSMWAIYLLSMTYVIVDKYDKLSYKHCLLRSGLLLITTIYFIVIVINFNNYTNMTMVLNDIISSMWLMLINYLADRFIIEH